MSRRLARQVPDPEERLHILKTVHHQATRAGVEPELVLAVIDVESNFDRFAISSATALGLMQVMPFWVPELGYQDKNQLFDIEINVLLGCRILKYYLDMERGDLAPRPRALQRQRRQALVFGPRDRAATDEVVSALSATSRRRSRAARRPSTPRREPLRRAPQAAPARASRPTRRRPPAHRRRRLRRARRRGS